MSIRTPLNNGFLQSDLDVAGFNLLNYTPGGGGTAHGIPAGGSSGQSLTKIDGTDYNVHWSTVTGGGSIGTALGMRVNVKDAPYNAHGDGVTDDTVAIQAAINAVHSAGGGTVFFPKGIYLCNGAFDTFWKSILTIPFVNNATTDSPRTLQLLGEGLPSWAVVSAAQNEMWNSTIKTTRTDGMTADTNGFAAILAGMQPLGNGRHATFGDYNGTFVHIKNLRFLCPDDPTMGGIRLDGVGWAVVENTYVNGGGSQPTHGTTGIWMPNCINWSTSFLNLANAAGFDTGFKVSEHTHAVWIQAWGCLTGVAILESMYPLRGTMQFGNCVNAIKFLGQATVDFLMETEHAPSGWMSASHDVSDHSNFGSGTIRYYIGAGFPPADTALAIDGGTGLTLIDMFSGKITLPSIGSLVGNVFATTLLVGFTDTGLGRNNAGIVEVNSGVAGTFRELLARSVKLNAVTVATLPASPSIGQVASVSDGTASLAWGATVTGGGSTKYLVWYNGAAWTVAGK